jgi:outer membrane receptor for ferrienterochelin and colicins
LLTESKRCSGKRRGRKMKVQDSYKKKSQLQIGARYFVTSLIMVVFVFAVVFGVLGVGPVMAGQAEAGEKKETVKQPVEIEQTIVTATRTEIEVKEVPMSVEVVTREEIDALDADNVMDILRFSTGINFYRDKNYRTPMIRGFEGKHSLVLIDGRRIASRSSGGDPFWFSTNNIERIEIVRGPASSLYGSDALGGVINIITKRPKKGLTFDFSTKYGSYAHESDTTMGKFYSGYGAEKWGVSISSYFMNQNPYNSPTGETYCGDYEYNNVAGKFYYNFSKALSLVADVDYMKDDEDDRVLHPKGWLYTLDAEEDVTDYSLKLDYSGTTLKGFLRGYYSERHHDGEERYLNDTLIKGSMKEAGTIKNFVDGHRKTKVVETQISTFLFDSHLFTLGGDFRRESFKTTNINTGHDYFWSTKDGMTKRGSSSEIDYWAFFLQDEWQIGDKLLVVPGLRYDHSEFGDEVSPKVGVTYNLYEVALEGEYGRFSGRIAYFYNDVKDLIEKVRKGPDPDNPGWTLVENENISKAHIQGLEIEAGVSIFEELSFSASYAYLDAENADTKERLEWRARNRWIGKLSYNLAKYQVKANFWGEYTGDYLLAEKNYSYALFYLNVAKGIGKHLEAFVGVDNLFDKEVKDLEMPILGAFYYGGLRISF